MKIYIDDFKFDEEKHTPFQVVEELLTGNGYGLSKRTIYEDGSEQCGPGRFRSIGESTIILQTYFPEITKLEVFKTIAKFIATYNYQVSLILETFNWDRYDFEWCEECESNECNTWCENYRNIPELFEFIICPDINEYVFYRNQTSYEYLICGLIHRSRNIYIYINGYTGKYESIKKIFDELGINIKSFKEDHESISNPLEHFEKIFGESIDKTYVPKSLLEFIKK